MYSVPPFRQGYPRYLILTICAFTLKCQSALFAERFSFTLIYVGDFHEKGISSCFTATIPVLCGYLFIGFAFGVMLRDIGFGSIWSFFCSLSIYAGSGQYLLVSLLAAKASLVTVAVMTLLLNCRHIFYGLSFLETFHEMGRRKWYMIFSLTDETYSLLCSVKTPGGH